MSHFHTPSHGGHAITARRAPVNILSGRQLKSPSRNVFLAEKDKCFPKHRAKPKRTRSALEPPPNSLRQRHRSHPRQNRLPPHGSPGMEPAELQCRPSQKVLPHALNKIHAPVQIDVTSSRIPCYYFYNYYHNHYQVTGMYLISLQMENRCHKKRLASALCEYPRDLM